MQGAISYKTACYILFLNRRSSYSDIIDHFLLLTALILGVSSGIFTGLIPGIHPNTVIFVSLPFYLNSDISSLVYVLYITGLSVSHTLHDFLPAIFLSSPDADSALSAGYVEGAIDEGKGLELFYQTVYGGFSSVLAVIFISILSFYYLKSVYGVLESIMGQILLFFLFFIVLSSEKKRVSVVLVILSGVLGLISFQTNINQNFVFIPLFTGLFAIPALADILFSQREISEQKEPDLNRANFVKGGLIGSLSGFMAGIVPGIGPAVSTTFLSPLMEDADEMFMPAMGAVNTTDIIFSLVALVVIGNPRSGTSVAVSILSLGEWVIYALIVVCIFTVFLSGIISLKISRLYLKFLNAFSMNWIISAVLITIITLVLYFTGFTGILVLLASSLIGRVAAVEDERKACMAVLIVPALMYFFNYSILI